MGSKIYAKSGWVGIICGGAKDESFASAMRANGNVPLENWAGRTSLLELVAIIKGARLLVSNETSAVHIAAAVSTRTVCILGGGHYGQFVPYPTRFGPQSDNTNCAEHKMDSFGCNWKCIFRLAVHEAVPCIANITVDEILTRVESTLDENKALPG